VIALTCSEAEQGRDRWTLQMLADKLVEVQLVESIARETIRQLLSKNELKPWLKKQWCLPPKSNGEFVSQMEDVLSVDMRPIDERFPQVCVDAHEQAVDRRDARSLAHAARAARMLRL